MQVWGDRNNNSVNSRIVQSRSVIPITFETTVQLTIVTGPINVPACIADRDIASQRRKRAAVHSRDETTAEKSDIELSSPNVIMRRGYRENQNEVLIAKILSPDADKDPKRSLKQTCCPSDRRLSRVCCHTA